MGTIGMKMRNTAAGIARRAAAHRAVLDALVAKMHADYMRPMSLHDVGKKYDRTHSCVRELFERRGLFVRPFKKIPRQANGSPMPHVPFTPAQIDAMIAQATRFAVPVELKFEWRSWSLARRGDFIARLRAKIKRIWDRPDRPFSSNVEPFDYASPRAHAIAKKVNAGLDARQRWQTIKILSQGVIYQEQLWFWSAKAGYCLGAWLEEDGRPQLHRHIFAEHNRRVLGDGDVIRHADGNPNNLSPANLVLATRNDVARENQAAALARKSRERTALILHRSQKTHRHDLSDTLLASRR